MVASELRIGNWINTYCNGDRRNIVVEQLDEEMLNGFKSYLRECEGILLTTQILVKSGFIKDDWVFVFPYNGGNSAYSIEQYGDLFGFAYAGDLSKETWVKYVHQLQNLYYALTGEEIKIKL